MAKEKKIKDRGKPAADLAAKNHQLQESLRRLEDELQVQLDRGNRLAADYANFQRRSEEEARLVARRANDETLQRLFPIFDSFYLAIKHSPEEIMEKPNLGPENRKLIVQYIQGIKLIERQLEEVLSNLGLMRIVAKGQLFDPERHEAVSYEPNGEVPPETVIEEIETGWLIDGVVVKPAKVRVSKGHNA